MMAFPAMLVGAAKSAGMACPPDPDTFDREAFPHFEVFCALQLCRSMQPGEHWDNARVIAAIPEDKLKTMSLGDFVERGLCFTFN